jgi:hydrogenase/urease accessory protein HupE
VVRVTVNEQYGHADVTSSSSIVSALRRFFLALIGCLLTGLVMPRTASAHEELVTTCFVEVGERDVRVRLDVGLDGLLKAGLLSANDAGRADLLEHQETISAALARGLTVSADGRELTATPAGLTPVAGAPRAEQRFTFEGTLPISDLTLRAAFLPALGAEHRTVVRVTWHGQARTFVNRGPLDLHLTPAQMVVSTGETVRQFLGWGVEHIFLGYDHLAFVLALLLGVTRLREVVAVVSSFTVAHSLTLALSSLEVLRVPVRVSEVLVAASIVYVAVENMGWLVATRRHRWVVAFAFGLVHGLGFATELRARLEDAGRSLFAAILSFNVGVELGQVAVVVVAWPLLARLRRGEDARDAGIRQRRLARMGSVPILACGLYWLFDRLLG